MTLKDIDLSLPMRPLPPTLTTWYDSTRCRTMYRLSRDDKYVEQPITDEEMVSVPSTWQIVHDVIATLCVRWHMRFGERIIPERPGGEAQPWSVRYDNTIDGEVVVREIEGGDKHATRGCIEGR